MSVKLPTIIDNRNDNTMLAALQLLLNQTKKLEIATGTFEIGSMLSLEGNWQVSDKIRVVMGDETSRRTKQELVEALNHVSNESIEDAKERDDNLTGLEAIRKALKSKTMGVRVYSKSRFHPKCFIMDTREPNLVDFAIVGSSNFTRSGLTKNLELNLLTTDQLHIDKLREWYSEIWKEADNVNEAILKVIEPHLSEYSPFTVYLKALYEYFAGREKLQDEWESEESVIYRILSQYQKDGYHRALQIADSWGGALICDGVGIGKTFIGLMILERCIKDGKRVLLIVVFRVVDMATNMNPYGEI